MPSAVPVLCGEGAGRIDCLRHAGRSEVKKSSGVGFALKTWEHENDEDNNQLRIPSEQHIMHIVA